MHYLDPRRCCVQRISKLLTTGGEILVLEPNALNPLIQLEMLMKRGTKTIVEAVDTVATREPCFYGNEESSLQGTFGGNSDWLASMARPN